MHSYATIGMLALAGSAVARPHWGGGYQVGGGNGGGNPVVVYETAMVTVVVGPDGQPAAAPTPAAEAETESQQYEQAPAPAAPSPTQQVEVWTSWYVEQSQPAATPAPESGSGYNTPSQPEPQPEPSSSAAPAPAASSAAPSSGDSGSGYIGTVNTWRQKLGKSTFSHDATLEKNALKTCDDGNGQMQHELNEGTMGQVLAPGEQNEFERVFVGGWLCEKPNMAGMDGICNEMSDGWNYEGQTGHADILTGDYSKIGCAWAAGIWGCDVA